MICQSDFKEKIHSVWQKQNFQHTQDWPDKSYTVVCKLGGGKLANSN